MVLTAFNYFFNLSWFLFQYITLREWFCNIYELLVVLETRIVSSFKKTTVVWGISWLWCLRNVKHRLDLLIRNFLPGNFNLESPDYEFHLWENYINWVGLTKSFVIRRDLISRIMMITVEMLLWVQYSFVFFCWKPNAQYWFIIGKFFAVSPCLLIIVKMKHIICYGAFYAFRLLKLFGS